MKTYTIKNITTNESYSRELSYDGTYTGPLCNFIEEQLYILWELTPVKPRLGWAYPFLRGERIQFTYHGCEFVWVWMDKEGNILTEDIPFGRKE